MELPGVGSKVADCILLYGAGRYESFPLDTWMLKALVFRYGCDPKNTTAMHAFVSGHFGPHAGIAQQYIFAYEREVQELRTRVGSIRSER
jgi:N-glycosylase/DNA lyase